LVVSGSSSFLIKRKFKDSLVGRTVEFELLPLSFDEFLVFKEEKFDLSQSKVPEIITNKLKKLYGEFVTYGVIRPLFWKVILKKRSKNQANY